MRAEELLETLTDEQLKQRANYSFLQAEETALYKRPSPEERLRLLTEADFYLKALAWRHDAQIAERDFRLEKIVIALISVEIVLSLIFGFLGLWEGWKQGKALDAQVSALNHMDTSTGATAEAMKTARDSLKSLADAQAESLQRFKEMNDKLQASLTTTGTMASTTRKQLGILEQQQTEHAAQLSKKPKLQLQVGSVPAVTRPFNALRPDTYPIRDQTDTSITFDSGVFNEGTAPATRVQIRVVVGATDVSFSASTRATPANEPPDNPFKTWLINIDLIRPNVNVPMTLTFSFPKGHAPFDVLINADADEIETGTPLGNFTITPRKPANDK